jgi:hypothetical protein
MGKKISSPCIPKNVFILHTHWSLTFRILDWELKLEFWGYHFYCFHTTDKRANAISILNFILIKSSVFYGNLQDLISVCTTLTFQKLIPALDLHFPIVLFTQGTFSIWNLIDFTYGNFFLELFLNIGLLSIFSVLSLWNTCDLELDVENWFSVIIILFYCWHSIFLFFLYILENFPSFIF